MSHTQSADLSFELGTVKDFVFVPFKQIHQHISKALHTHTVVDGGRFHFFFLCAQNAIMNEALKHIFWPGKID
jgi:hypothetical protein